MTVALGSPDGAPVAEERVELSIDQQPLPALRRAGEMLDALLEQQGAARADLTAVAAGIPEPLSPEGDVRIPTMLGNGRMNHPRQALEDMLGMPVHAVNDTVVGAMGEMQAGGAAQGARDFLYLKASHGIRETLDRLTQPAIANGIAVVPGAHGLRAEMLGTLALARAHALQGQGLGVAPH